MTVVVIGDNTGDDYSGIEDVFIQQDTPDTNRNGGNLRLKYHTGAFKVHSLLRISNAGLSNVPSSATINSASVSLFANGNGNGVPVTGTMRRALQSWVDAEATWNSWASGNNWTTAGGLSDGNDRSGTSSAVQTIDSDSTGYYTWSGAQLTADVQGIVDGTYANQGWHIQATAGGVAVADFESANIGTDGQRPYATLDYTAGAGGSFQPAWAVNSNQVIQ